MTESKLTKTVLNPQLCPFPAGSATRITFSKYNFSNQFCSYSLSGCSRRLNKQSFLDSLLWKMRYWSQQQFPLTFCRVWASQLPKPVMMILCHSLSHEKIARTWFFKDFKTKIITLTISHNWYHKDNWQNKPFNLIIKTWKYFFLLRNADRPLKLFSKQDTFL